MNTRQNRARVLASFLRGAIKTFARAPMDGTAVVVPVRDYADAIAAVRDVAEELEQLATAPDPATIPSEGR